MHTIEDLVNKNIIAIIPEYIQNYGNSTKIITENSDEVLKYKRLHTVIKNIAKIYAVDLKAIREYCKKIIGVSNVVPIPLGRSIFIPLKVRKPISRNDGCFGYFNIDYITNVKQEGRFVIVTLNGNIEVKVLQSLKVTKNHIHHGKILKRIYLSKITPVVSEQSEAFYIDFNKPATKGDIAALRNEILYIKSRLK